MTELHSNTSNGRGPSGRAMTSTTRRGVPVEHPKRCSPMQRIGYSANLLRSLTFANPVWPLKMRAGFMGVSVEARSRRRLSVASRISITRFYEALETECVYT